MQSCSCFCVLHPPLLLFNRHGVVSTFGTQFQCCVYFWHTISVGYTVEARIDNLNARIFSVPDKWITNQLVNKLSCWKYNISLEARL